MKGFIAWQRGKKRGKKNQTVFGHITVKFKDVKEKKKSPKA